MIFDVVEKAASQLCMALFRVRCLFDRSTTTYIGFEHNVEAATFAHFFVIEQCGRDLKAFKKRRWQTTHKRTSKGAAHHYCDGWVYGVESRYQRELAAVEPDAMLEDSKTALILRDQDQEVADYMQSHHGDVKDEKHRRYKEDNAALMSGIRDGLKVSINRPLKDNAAPLQLSA